LTTETGDGIIISCGRRLFGSFIMNINIGPGKPKISPCFKHPNYDFVGDIPNDPKDKDGICYICLGAKKIYKTYLDKLEEFNKIKKKQGIKKTKNIISKPRTKIVISTALEESIKNGNTLPKCYEHSNYRGLRRPRNNCEACIAIYKRRKELGIKETRKRRL
jgi:hypothetical protein